MVTDPPGDATEYNSGFPTVLPYKCRVAGGLVWGACATAAAPALASLPPAAGPMAAPPSLDVLSLTLAERPDAVVVGIEVAGLDEAFTGAVAADGSRTALWAACWRAEEGVECPYLAAGRVNGRLSLDAILFQGGDCNAWGFCWWKVPYEIEYGSPATIRLVVPRSVLLGGGAGAVLAAPVLFAQTEPPARDLPGAAGSFHWQACGAVEEFGRHDGNHNEYAADWTGPGSDFAFATPAAPDAGSTDRFEVPDAAGDGAGDRADADILAVEFLETASTFTVATRVARVDDPPADHTHLVTLGLSTGPVLEVGYRAAEGRITPYSSSCAPPPAVEIATAPASPGWINLTFDRASLGSPHAGDLVNLFMAQQWTPAAFEEAAAGPATLRAAAGAAADVAFVPPYRFRGDSAPGPA